MNLTERLWLNETRSCWNNFFEITDDYANTVVLEHRSEIAQKVETYNSIIRYLIQGISACRTWVLCVCTISPLSLPQSPFSRSLRSNICNLGHPHPMRTLRITNGGPERAKKQSLGEREGRSCKHRIADEPFTVVYV